MADMRRRRPEPPPGAPQIQLKPGLAKETLRELAPLLAEEGIGVALGLLDDWLTSADPHAPSGLAQRVSLPAGHWLGERAATDILVLARKGRAFGSLDTLIARQGGQHVLYGSALTLTATAQTWAAGNDTPIPELARAQVR